MDKIRNIYKAFVMMFSEVIWIYYAIVIMTSVEWDKAAYFNMKWWVAAAIIGYSLNALLTNRSPNIILVVLNLTSIGYLSIQNWRSVVPQGAWWFGIFVSIGIVVIFVRSARLVLKQPTRQEILRRFEGNVIYYTIFAVIIAANNWSNQEFHFLFIFGIINSLMAMILTLKNHEEVEKDQRIKVIKVGKSGWFVGGITILLIIVPLFSIGLMVPSVRTMIYACGINVWNTITLIWYKVVELFSWLFSFLPEVEMQGELPGKPPELIEKPVDKTKEFIVSVPYRIMIGMVVFFLIGAFIWFFAKFVRGRHNLKSLAIKEITVYRKPWWLNFKKRFISCLHKLKKKYLMSFSYFYINIIYWYYYEIMKWGSKNGLAKKSWETSKEYIGRIINYIPESQKKFSIDGKTYILTEILIELNEEYQAAYYGGKIGKNDRTRYEIMIKHLKNIKIHSKSG